jgi:hypothetical protein
MEEHGRHCKSWKYIIGNVIVYRDVYRDVYCEGLVSRARLASNFRFARNQSRIDAKHGSHFPQADFSGLIRTVEPMCDDSWEYRPFANPAAQNYPAIIPPSTGIEAPVMYDAFAEATKAITRAISSGVAKRLTGTVETSAALFFSVLVKRVSIPVSVVPGATTFTRTPVEKFSRAVGASGPR